MRGKNEANVRLISYITPISAILASSLGVVVLIGWHAKNTYLLQIHPSFAPMQYNTALGFLTGGAGLFAALRSMKNLSVTCAFFLICIGCVTLIQYFLNIDLKIDELLVKSFVITQTSEPGRMAPNTALCFVFFGACLLMHHSEGAGWGIMRWGFNIGVFILSLMALLGYIFDSEKAYGWSDMTRMAIHTSIGFIVLSIGYGVGLWLRTHPKAYLLPLFKKRLLLLIGIMALSVICSIATSQYLMYVASLSKQRQHLENTIKIICSLIDSITEFDQRFSGKDISGGAEAATLLQIRRAFLRFHQLDIGDEIVLARSVESGIEFIQPISFIMTQQEVNKLIDRNIVLPVYRALNGETGSGISVDYKGEQVLAAYAPVTLLNLGLAVKINMSDIRMPFIHAALQTSIIALILIVSGSILFLIINESMMREAKLSEDRFSSVFEQAAVGFAFLSPDGQWEKVNKRLSELLGYSEEELINKNFKDLTHPDDLPDDHENIGYLLAGHIETYSKEKRYLDKNKNIVWINLTVSLVRSDSGEPEYFIAVIEDISERKQLEIETTLHEQKYKSIYESVPISLWEEDWSDVIYMVNGLHNDGVSDFERYFKENPDFIQAALARVKIIDVNPETVEMFDADTKKDLLESLEKVFATDDTLPGFIGEMVALAEGKRKYAAEMKLCTVKGEFIHVSLTMAFPAYDDDSGRVLVSLMDISPRIKAEEKVRESEKRFRAYFELGQIGMAMTSVDKGWLNANQKLCEILDYSKEELFELTWAEMTHSDDLENDVKQFTRMLNGQIHDYSMEKRFFKKDGSVVHASISVACVRNADQAVDYVIAHILDISDRIKAEHEIRELNQSLESRVRRRTAELEAANIDLESFSYSVSHDLRAPLRHISGFGDLLAEAIASQDQKSSERYLKIIRDASDRLGLLIDELLKFSRMSRAPLNTIDTDMNELVKTLVEEARPEWQNLNVDWRIGALPVVNADPILLSSVLRNLISNALKYSKDSDPVIIQIDSIEEASQFVFFVRDNGMGFDMKYKDKLFKVFQRLHNDTGIEGTGIGLATVKRIIQRHQGECWAESEPGKGSSFYFSIPKGGYGV